MKARFKKHKNWTGKGNKGFEKLNILEWEKPTVWRVEVRGVPESRPWSSWNPRCPKARHLGHPVLRLIKNYRYPGHPASLLWVWSGHRPGGPRHSRPGGQRYLFLAKNAKGRGTLSCGLIKVSKTQGAPPGEI